MFKRILIFSFILFFLSVNCSFAINWKEIITPHNKIVYLDLDSIVELGSFYFYNLKYKNPINDKFSVFTIQTSKNKSMSAKINEYSLDDYEALKGDYNNISKNKTKNLEVNLFGSIIHTCHSEILKMNSANEVKIEF